MNGALGGIASVLRIGMGIDSKSQLGTGDNLMTSPPFDRTLNGTNLKFTYNDVSQNDSTQILIEDREHTQAGQSSNENPYQAAQDVSTMLP